MACKLCEARGKTWKGDDPKCAFDEHGRFCRRNWNCAAMNELRELAEKHGACMRRDRDAGSIGAFPWEGDERSGYIVMTWYKNRGATGNALVMWDDEPTQELTEAVALEAIEYWAKQTS